MLKICQSSYLIVFSVIFCATDITLKILENCLLGGRDNFGEVLLLIFPWASTFAIYWNYTSHTPHIGRKESIPGVLSCISPDGRKSLCTDHNYVSQVPFCTHDWEKVHGLKGNTIISVLESTTWVGRKPPCSNHNYVSQTPFCTHTWTQEFQTCWYNGIQEAVFVILIF